MSIFHVILLSIVQGLAELLPVSSSAHVVVAEKLLGMDPSAPAMTLLLVMLHTGTMFAVIVYFWKQWRAAYFQSAATFQRFAWLTILATFWTGLIGGGLIEFIEHVLLRGTPHAEVEQLFGRLDLIAPALAAAGILILIAGLYEKKHEGVLGTDTINPVGLNMQQAGWMGAVQGLCLPFRGFSRSGATISVGLWMNVAKAHAEAFSFALAVVLTPPAIAREALRLVKAEHLHGSAALASASLASAMMPSLLGAVCSFLAGLVALKWLSRWLESGRWYWFGIYCLVASVAVATLHHAGF